MSAPKQVVATSPSGPREMALPSCRSASLCTPNCGWSTVKQPDADLVIKPLDMAYEQRSRPQGLLFDSKIRARILQTGERSD